MNTTSKSTRNLIITIIIGVLLIGAVTLGLYGHYYWGWFQGKAADESVSPSTSSTPAPTSTTKPVSSAADENFKVDLGQYLVDQYASYSREWLTYSHTDNDQLRVKETGCSDAVSLPFKGETDEEIFDEIIEEILRSPVFGDMVARGIVDIKIDNHTLGELNDWLPEFIKQMDKFYAMGTGYDKAGSRGIENCLTTRKGEKGKIFTSDWYYYNACGIATIMKRLYPVGMVDGLESSENYHLNAAALDFARRTELNDKQENKTAFVLQYQDAKTDMVYVRVGFNKMDKRFEIFDKAADLPKKGPEPSAPPVDPDPTPVPTPTPTPTPSPTPPPDGEGGKDPEEDPVNNGNADIGGGDTQGSYPHEDPDTVKRPDGTTITDQDDKTEDTASDPKNDDEHKVDKVDGSETPLVVEKPITEDPEVNGEFTDGKETINNGNGQGEGASNGGEYVPAPLPRPF